MANRMPPPLLVPTENVEHTSRNCDRPASRPSLARNSSTNKLFAKNTTDGEIENRRVDFLPFCWRTLWWATLHP